MESDNNREKAPYSKRIRYLRRLILTSVAAACLIPICICVILAVRYDRLSARYEQAQADLDWYRSRYGTEMDILSSEGGSEEVKDVSPSEIPSSGADDMDVDYATVDVSGAQNPEDIEGTRYVYLTFDDGPSTNTDEILDILAQYDVKATFFV